MDDDLQTLIDMVNAELCGEQEPLAMAERIPYAELAEGIANVKFKEMFYNPQTERVLVYATPYEGMVIWLLPKR